MKKKSICVCLEHRYYKYNQRIYTRLSFPYDYWKSYLEVFDTVIVVARVKTVSLIDDSYQIADGKDVLFYEMPYYVGIMGFIVTLPASLVRAYKIVRLNRFFLLRSGNISNIIWLFIFLYRKRYLREYPGNIQEGVMGVAGSAWHIRFIAWILHNFSKLQGRYSVANSFVSDYCAHLYSSDRPDFIFSSFNLDEVTVMKENYQISSLTPTLITVCRLEDEKGLDYLLQAMHILSPFNCRLILVGDGRARLKLEAIASNMNLDIDFVGLLTNRPKLFTLIASADIFVLPSITEGLPRAILEAMAIAMPCVTTNVGGLPEVMEEKYMVSPSNALELAELLRRLFIDEQERTNAGLRNFSFVAERYSTKVLRERKHQFWGMLFNE